MRAPLFVRWTVLAACLAGGCESVRSPMGGMFGGSGDKELVAEKQTAYRLEGDAAAIRWLLAHRIESGMTLDEVEAELGTDGEPVHGAAFKNKGGTRFQVTDSVYKWGPDAKGDAYYLVFRDERLLNFDRRQFR